MMFLLIVTLTSMLLAAIMSVIAWRIAGDDRRRSDARIAALAAEIHDTAPVSVAITTPMGATRRADRTGQHWEEDLELRPAARASASTDLFVTPSPGSRLFAAPPARSGPRLFAVLAGGALVFGTVVVVAIAGGSVSRAPMWRPALAGPAPRRAPAPAAQPLELVALGHERVGDRLTVRGVVHNPASGAEMDRLTAVVLLFTTEGGFIAGGRAAVETPALRPGGEATFVVTVPDAGDVGRYRVSFRTDDRIVPHLDRRHES